MRRLNWFGWVLLGLFGWSGVRPFTKLGEPSDPTIVTQNIAVGTAVLCGALAVGIVTVGTKKN
jgi:hypothetical protein